MPGILPMKVIRAGNNAQNRVAQACDRCRSKKIRCDGIRPQCTQCSNVGFECRTSDKLSRRAFPRGYTESLEDRVRALEAEVRELKDLLDEKDEKIDVLSRIHSFSAPSRRGSASNSPAASERVKVDASTEKEGCLQVETRAPVGPSNPPNSQSCTSALIDAFARKVSISGKSCPEIREEAFRVRKKSPPASSGTPKPSKIPPRLLSDQYINVFFQEWAPLLPVLHRPTFLRIYEQYVAEPEAKKWYSNKQAVAQLFLVFDIAALSSLSLKQSTISYEIQWQKAMQSTSSTVCISTVQCHLLAQLYYLLKADYSHSVRHRAKAVKLGHQVGLRRCQKYYVMNCLELETQKKVFWCQYAMDKFISASSGSPTLLRDSDISTEYPEDIDDENLTEKGFLSFSTNEITKTSSAIALFKVCRILSRALDQLLPALASHKFSIDNLHSLSDDLDRWLQSIPDHLRMKFLNDKPSTGVISDRSPLLSLAYFFVRGLIHLPLVCHGSGSGMSASVIVTADSAKHIVQILELLEERRMNYCFPFNKTDLLLSSGFSLLWHCLELSPESKLVKDNQRSLRALTNLLTRDSLSVAVEFLRIAHSLVTIDVPASLASQSPPRTMQGSVSDRISTSAPELKMQSARRHLQVIASRFSSLKKPHQTPREDPDRKAIIPNISPTPLSSRCRSPSQLHRFSTQSLPVFPANPPSLSCAFMDLPPSAVNLDYLPLGKDHSSALSTPPWKEPAVSCYTGDVEDADSASANAYGGSQPGLGSEAATFTNPQGQLDEEWPLSAIEQSAKRPAPQSVESASEDSMTGGEEFSGYGGNNSSATCGPVDHFDSGCNSFSNVPMPAFAENRIDSNTHIIRP